MALAAGQTGHLADHQEGVYTVVHGATAGTARPTLGSSSTAPTVVLWVGSVEPSNAVNNDLWMDTTSGSPLSKVKVSGSFVTAGNGTYGTSATHARPAGATTQFGIPGVNPVGLVTGSPGANLLNYEPFVVDRTITVDRLAIEVVTATAASTVARLGIYASDSNWQPTDLVVDGGTVAVDSTGFKSVTVSATLAPGLYVAAYHSDAAPTLRIIRGGPTGLVETLGANAIVNRLRVSKAYAALADPGTAWDTRAGSTDGFHHFIALRW